MTSYKYTKTKLIYGVGVNDADYPVQPRLDGKQTECHFYRTWKHMLLRCYSSKFHKKQPTYIGCSVVGEWFSFTNFRKWMEKQDWKGKELDKDILIPGNKVYGPDACRFVSVRINNLISPRSRRKSNLPVGVYFRNDIKKIAACIRIDNKNKHLGFFNTKEEASSAYREAKRLYILRVACCEIDILIKQALFRHSELLR